MKPPAPGLWVALLALAAAGLLLSPFLPAPLGEPLLLLLAGLFPVLLMALGARRRDGLGRLGPVLLLLAVLLVGVLWAIGRFHRPLGEGPWPWGLPAVAWIFLLGLGVAPLVLVCWSYARTFFEQTLRPEELEHFHLRFPHRREP